MFGFLIARPLSLWAWLSAAAFQAFWAWRAPERGEHLLDDSITYLEIARHLPLSYSRFDGVADLQRPPAYPALLFVFYFLTGGGAFAVIVVQKLLVFATALGVYRTVSLFCTRRHARRSALLYLFLPYPALFSSLLLTETLFVAAAVWAMNWALRGQCWKTGMALAVCVLLKTLAAALVFCAAAALAGRSFRLRRGPADALIAAALPAAAFAAWTTFNHVRAGTAKFSLSSDVAKLYGVAAALDALAEGEKWDDETLVYYGEKRRGETHFVGDYPAQETAVFDAPFPWREMAARPLSAARFYLLALRGMFSGVGFATAEKISGSRLCALTIAVWGGFAIFAIWGAALSACRNPGFERTILAFVALALTLAHACAWADGRYRMPADVFMLMAAGSALWNPNQRMRKFCSLFATPRQRPTAKATCSAV
ncbi:MAG: glycosyltransferase family 39 protein [Bacteroidia bacterium]|nr:glycosyltransferase family 39 protein [Bacteroidia bacterium]MDW8333087.1 glycosyltransferase family 39 protein [Bacteroidia bacterium]